MNLKSFGCSFIYGCDLSDDRNGFRANDPSKLTWPALYAKDLGYDYKCYAKPGSGNLLITEKILNQIATKEPAVYVIGWTWIDRFDYMNANEKWHAVMPSDNTEKSTVYYRDLHSQYRDKLTTLINIKLIIDTLKANGLPFIMTYMDELMFETEWHTSPAVTELQEYVKPYMTKFNGKSFLEWSREQGYPESPSWHPLDEAHSSAYNYIKQLNLL